MRLMGELAEKDMKEIPDVTDESAAGMQETEDSQENSEDRQVQVAKKKLLATRLREAAGKRKQLVLRRIELERIRRVRRKTVPGYTHCKNCGTMLEGMYCHRCGQYALDVEQPFWKYVKQYFENVYQFDSKVWITLWMLFRRPGFLTKEFNAGKIVSYVHPMRLLMFITVLFFLFFFIKVGNVLDSITEAGHAENMARTRLMNQEFLAYAGKWIPLMVLLLSPFLAFLCKLLYRRCRVNYMGNFVFVLHLLSFVFIVLAACMLLVSWFPQQSWVWTWCFSLYVLFYTIVASHRVYANTGWIKSTVKSVLMWTVFLLVLSAALVGLMVLIANRMDVL